MKLISTLKSYIPKASKYFLVGITTTSIYLGGITALTELAGFHYQISNLISFSVATIIGFIGQKYFTFKNHGKNYLGQLIHFTGVAIIGLGINTGTVYLFEEVFSLGYLAGAVVSSAIVFMVKFPLNNFFTFKEPQLETVDTVK